MGAHPGEGEVTPRIVLLDLWQRADPPHLCDRHHSLRQSEVTVRSGVVHLPEVDPRVRGDGDESMEPKLIADRPGQNRAERSEKEDTGEERSAPATAAGNKNEDGDRDGQERHLR